MEYWVQLLNRTVVQLNDPVEIQMNDAPEIMNVLLAQFMWSISSVRQSRCKDK